MVQFYNPLDKGLTRTQLVSWILYAIFIGASIWATAESITRTTRLPRIYCYIISFAFLTGASFCLALIKLSLASGYVRARPAKLVVGSVGFLFLWAVSFTSNTHNFYFVSTVDDLRRTELGQALESHRLLSARTNLAIQTAKEALRAEVEARIERMKSEILNPGDPGAGRETERIVVEIEELLQREVQRLDRRSQRFTDLRDYADAMATQIRGLLDTRLAEIDESLSILNNYLAQQKYAQMLDRLETVLVNGIASLDGDALKALLRSAFEMYNEGVRLARQAFHAPVLIVAAPDLQPLPETPRSIRLENIASAWRDFLSGTFEPWKFWLSVLWAIALDAAAFILFYFGILPRDDV